MQHLALCDWLLSLGVVLQAQWCCHMQLEPSLPLGGGEPRTDLQGWSCPRLTNTHACESVVPRIDLLPSLSGPCSYWRTTLDLWCFCSTHFSNISNNNLGVSFTQLLCFLDTILF